MGGRTRQPIRLYVIGALGLLIMAGLSEIGSRWLATWIGPVHHDGPALGSVAESKGKVIRTRAGRAQARGDLNGEPLDLKDGDRLETGADGQATLILASQDELTVPPRTTLTFELWNHRDPASPIYVHVVAGDVSPRRAGVRGRAYVVRGGRLFLPGQKPGLKGPPLLIGRGATVDLSLKDAPADAPAGPNETTSAVTDPEPAAGRPDDPETLSNEYVEDMIGSRRTQLQKCWMSRLKDKPDLRGKLTVQFEITRRGHVRDVSVVDSTLGDPALSACVSTVIERLPFRGFRGPEIAIAYPITFE